MAAISTPRAAASPGGGHDPAANPRGDAQHPSGDARFRMLDASMKRHRYAPESLIEVLHTAQELFGFLQPDILYYVAHHLKLPPSRVYGVATFYHFFTLTPRGEHTCVVCTGTACYVKGADRILAAVEGALATVAGKTTADGRVSLGVARCLGACGLAPVVVYDGEVAGNQAAESAVERLKGWKADGPR
jgi:bidirectional [NiFe] hydrogenase diaphorase subunit